MPGSGEENSEVSLRKGFKTKANELSRTIRSELGIRANLPMSPWLVAEHLDIPVLALSSLSAEAPSAVNHFSVRKQGAFSGMTVFDGFSQIVVINDSHSSGRQANDLSHEIAHALLFHQPSPALNDNGNRHWDGVIEEEAS